MTIVDTLELPAYPKIASGKVREIFDLGRHYLFVATDRISAFDVVLPTGIPQKGKVLTQLSKFWFEFMSEDVANHMVSTHFDDLPESLHDLRDLLDGRFMIVEKLKMIPVECVVRGYLVGSGYKEYAADGTVCGIQLPTGLQLAQKLAEPIFTPARKAQDGHDENISFETMANIVGNEMAVTLRDMSIEIYQRAANHALRQGVIIADTKFEFGTRDGKLMLADEVLTPDSSRYWPQESYQPGKNPPSYDKQFVRDYLETVSWDKTPPGPELPENIVFGTADRYLECYATLVGKPLGS